MSKPWWKTFKNKRKSTFSTFSTFINFNRLIDQLQELEDYKEELKIQISNTFKDFKISEVKMKSNLTVIKASQTALESLKQEYDIGTKTITNLIEEEGKLMSAKVAYLNSKKDYLVNYFKIKFFEGSLLTLFDKYLPSIN